MFSCCSGRKGTSIKVNREHEEAEKIEELKKQHEEELEKLKKEKEEEIKSFKRDTEELGEKTMEKLKSEIKDLQEKNLTLGKSLRRQELTHNTDEMHMQQLQKDLSNLQEHEKMAIENWKAKLENAKNHEKTALEHERALATAKITAEIAKEKVLMEKIEELKKQHEKDEDENRKRSENLSSLQQELAALQSRLKLKEESYQNSIGSLKEDERDALEKVRSEEREKAAQKEAELNKKIQNLMNVHNNDEHELEQRETNLRDLRDMLKKTQSSLALRAKEHEDFVKKTKAMEAEAKRERDDLQKKMSEEKARLQKELDEEKAKAKREVEIEKEKEKELELAKEKLENEIQNLRTSDEGERKNLEEKLKQAHNELEAAKTSTQDKEKMLNDKMNALQKKLELEIEKEHKLESELKVSNERCARLSRAKTIFQKFLDVDDHGADILQTMEEFCECMVSSRGNLRGDKAKESLKNILKQSESKLRQSALKMFEATKGLDDSKKSVISKHRFRTFLQVLFIRYPTLIGGQLLTKLKDLEENSDNEIEIDFWDSKYEVMMFNVPPNEDTMRGAVSAIDKRMDKYCGERKKDNPSVTWDEFEELIVDDMIGVLHKHTSEMGLKGLYMINDYKEELATKIKAALREIE